MALIKCPECEKEISDKTKVCIHCGYPIAEEREKAEKKAIEAQRAVWDARIQKFINDDSDEAIEEFLAIGNEGYARGFFCAGISYINRGEDLLALEYYQKAYDMDPEYDNGSIAFEMGFLYSRKKSPLFNPELALKYMSQAKTPIAYHIRAQRYNPGYENDGFENYKDVDLAIACYDKALSAGSKNKGVIYSDLGQLYRDGKENCYVLAACYLLLALRDDPSKSWRKENYERCINLVREKNGPIWKEHIEKICSADDINPMIDQVNVEINKQKEEQKRVQATPVIRCPNCGSTSVGRISTASRVFSTYMLGPFSSKIGKQFECYSCGFKW